MKASPSTINKIINECIEHNFKYAEQTTIKEDNRFVSFPYCTKNNFLCDYAGQHVGKYIICDGKLKQERNKDERD